MQDCEAPFKETRKTSRGGRSRPLKVVRPILLLAEPRGPERPSVERPTAECRIYVGNICEGIGIIKSYSRTRALRERRFPAAVFIYAAHRRPSAPDRPPLLLTLASLFPVLARLLCSRREIYDFETRARRYRQHTESGFTFSCPPKKCVVYFPGRGRGRESGPHNMFKKKKKKERVQRGVSPAGRQWS